MTTRATELEANLREVESEIASFAPTLIVVTKTYPLSDVEILYGLGVRNFGENRSSEGLEKSSTIDATWHYQGEIQSKKIREILGWADCLHSLDSQSHVEKISRTLEESQSSINLFLQLSLDGNPDRGGLLESELFTLAEKVSTIKEVNLMGIMSVPPVDFAPEPAFQEIGAIHQRFIKAFPDSPSLSAGMSGDYMIALEHGATHIRVGSKILGARQYR